MDATRTIKRPGKRACFRKRLRSDGLLFSTGQNAGQQILSNGCCQDVFFRGAASEILF